MSGNGSRMLVVMAVVKGVVAVILIGSACYSWIVGIDVPSWAIAAIVAVLGVYFGFSTNVYANLARERQRVEEMLRRKDY